MYMENVNKLALDILEKGFVMSLATVDKGGPWVSDVVYVFTTQFELYWKSFDMCRHSEAIVTNNKVAANITLTQSHKEPDIGLQLEGTAVKIEGELPEMEEKLNRKMGKESFVKEGGEAKSGHSWYKLTPSKIEVINQPLLGFKKQQVAL